jgi:hypothetical protein
MKAAITLLALAGCGRIGFDDPHGVARCPIGPDPGWSVADGYRAVVVTDALDAPSAVTYAGGAFGGRLFVANSGDATVHALDPRTGAASTFVSAAAWASPPAATTALIWDGAGMFDGSLYLADRGTGFDGDSTIHAIDATGATRVVAAAPGPALDDVYSLAFVDDDGYGTGLYVTGDTDIGSENWARYTAAGGGMPFSGVAGVSGIAVDARHEFGGGVFAARPSNQSFGGDDSIVKLSETGGARYTLAADLDDVHAAVFAPGGELSGWLYAATRDTVVRVDPNGVIATIVAGVSFDTHDGNVIAFADDGDAMYVVSRSENRLVCIEPTSNALGELPDAPPPPPPSGGGATGD